MKKWLILLLILVVLMQGGKKEGKFSAKCTSDKEGIEIYNKYTNENVVIGCGEGYECKKLISTVECVSKEIEEEIEEEPKTSYVPLLIASIIFMIWRKKWQKTT